MTVPDIAALSDADALRVLALVVDHAQPLPEPAQLRVIEDRLREAAEDGTDAEPPSTPGQLARETLQHLAGDPAGAAVVGRAAAMPVDQHRLDPATFGVGALVVLALQTEVELTRTEAGKWRIHIHKKAMRDATLGRLLAKLISLYRSPGQ